MGKQVTKPREESFYVLVRMFKRCANECINLIRLSVTHHFSPLSWRKSAVSAASKSARDGCVSLVQ